MEKATHKPNEDLLLQLEILRNENNYLKKIQEDVRFNLQERSKELECHNKITSLINNPDLSSDDVLLSTVKLIPPAWQFPDITFAQIVYKEKEFRTEIFERSENSITNKIIIKGEEVGEISVFCSVQLNEKIKEPFLPEEEVLLSSIAEMLEVYLLKENKKITIRETERKYQDLVNNIHDILYEISFDGIIQFLSPSVENILGYRPDELTGKSYFDYVHQEDHQILREKAPGGDDKSRNIEYRFFKKNGDICWVRSTSKPIIENGKVTGRRGTLYNIDRQKKIEIRLKENEEKYRRLVESINDVIYEISIEGTINYVSPSIERIIGYKDSELTGKNFFHYMYPSDIPVIMEALSVLGFNDRSYLEYRYICKDGSLRWVRSSTKAIFKDGKVVGGTGALIDITEMKVAEAAIKQQNDKLTAVINTIPDLIFVLDENGIYLEYYASNDSTLIVDPAQIIGSNIRDTFPPEEVQYHLNYFEECLRTREIVTYEYMINLDGQKLYYEARLSAIDEHKILVLSRNITGKMIAEKEILELNTHLEQKITERTQELKALNEQLIKESEHNKELQITISNQHERLEQILTSTKIGTWEWEIKTDKLILNNQFFINLGYEKEDIVHTMTQALNLLHPDSLAPAREAITKLLNKETDFVDIEVQQLHKTEGYIWLNERARIVQFDKDGNPEWMSGTMIPIQEQKRMQLFEKEILEISQLLTGLTYENTNHVLNIALEKIGMFLEADRSYIFEFSPDSKLLYNTNEWCSEGISAEKENNQALSIDFFPEWSKLLQNNKPIIIPSVEDLPEEWAFEKEFIQSQGVQSTVCIPIKDDKVIGFFGIDNVRIKRVYDDKEINMLAFFSSMLANILTAKRKDESLRLTQLNYEAFYNSIDDYLFILDNEGKIIGFNAVVTQKLGYTADEIIGESISFVRDKSRLDEAKFTFEKIVKGEVDSCSIPLETKDGRLITVESTIKRGFWNDKEVFYCLSKDMTEIISSEQKFASAFHSNSAMMSISSVKTGKFLDVNQSFLDIHGYSREEVIGKSSQELGLFLYPQQATEALEILNRENKLRDFEFDFVTTEGQKRSGLMSTDFIYLGEEMCRLTVVIDITEKKISEQKFACAFNTEAAMMTILRLSDYTITDTNEKLTELTGFTKDEVLGKTNLEIGLFRNETLSDSLKVRFAEKKVIRNEEVEVYTKSQKKLTCLLSVEFVQIGDEPSILSMLVDISERKEMEVKLTEAIKEAEKANAAKSEFLSRMSHELRTPMNSILGFAQLLKLGNINPKQVNGVNHILKSGKHLLDLINEVLDISRIESGRLSLSMEPVEVNSVINEVFDLVKPLALEKNVRLLFEPELSRLIFVKVDKQRFKQILINLVNNAVKYNVPEGKVNLKVNVIQAPENINSCVQISVIDTGIGIHAEDITKLFIPFQRIGAEDSGTEGTGLGLSVVKKLVEIMNGKVGIESEPGVGSTFWINFPSTTSDLENLEHIIAPDEHNSENQKQGTVLYIEDNISNIELVEQILSSHMPGIKLITNKHGSQAVRLAKNHLPDMVLLDLNLPDIQGEEVLELLKKDELTQHIPVVILSADAMPHQLKKLLNAGAVQYLTKPLDVVEFLQTVQKYVNNQAGIL